MTASNVNSMHLPGCLRLWHRGFRLMLSFAALFFFATNSYALVTCSVTNPKFSSNSITFSSRVPIKSVVWTGTYSTTLTCTDPTSTGKVKATHVSTDPSFKIYIPGFFTDDAHSIIYKSDGTSSGLGYSIDIYSGGLNVTGACKWTGQKSANSASSQGGTFSAPAFWVEGTGPCTITINAPVVITKQEESPTGPIWEQSPKGDLYPNVGTNYWLSAPRDCNYGSGNIPLCGGGGTYPLQRAISVAQTTPTCSITQAGKTLTVTLPKVSTKSLTPSGTTAGRTRFVINYNNCNALFTTTHTWQYTSQDDVNGNGVPYINNSDWASPAGNVAVRILDENFKELLSGDSSTFTITAVGQSKVLTFYAEYISFGTPTGGAIQSYATYLVYYN